MPLVEGSSRRSQARLGVVAARRREEGNAVSVDVFYSKIPHVTSDDTVIIADPMLATGLTMCKAIEEVYKTGSPGRLIVTTVIATPIGVERVISRFPHAEIYAVAIDPALNDKAFIVPGLGDAGDRAFST
jgi:uracil phosphoribosyltransferase (EC 2.4.2.9)